MSRPADSPATDRWVHAGRALVFITACAVLTAVSYAEGERYLSTWLRFFLVETNQLLPAGFAADSIALVKRNGERLIAINARTSPAVYSLGVLPPDKTYELTTLQAYALAHPVLLFSILASWPVGGSVRRRIRLLLLGIPCVAISTSLDIPFVLAGLARGFVLGSLDPSRLSSDALVIYYAFVQRGGRYGLIIAIAALVAIISSRPPSRTSSARDPPPAAVP